MQNFPAFSPTPDALPQQMLNKSPDPSATATWIENLLSAVPDPEIPVVSIRELGILRAVRVEGDGVEVVITPTYSGCPAIDQISDDIRLALKPHGIAPRITLQLSPAWTTDWMSQATKEKLRAYGIAPPHGNANGTANVSDTSAANGNIILFAPNFMAQKRGKQGFGADAAVQCPQCGSHDTTETSHFGSTACKALYKCLACAEPFDYFKPY